MPIAPDDQDTSCDVVFIRNWTDTTRHGRMQDYPASEKSVRLTKAAADAALASGAARLAADGAAPLAGDESEGDGAAEDEAEA